MITLARPVLTTASLLALAIGTSGARAAETCSAYPTGTAEKIECPSTNMLSPRNRL
jgi:hypothetical protein